MSEAASNLASRRKRLDGALIDLLICTAIILPIMFATGASQGAFLGRQTTIDRQAIFFVIGCVVFLILNGYLLFNKGQTIGKVVVKTRIADLNGNVPNFGKILIQRYLILGLLGQIPILGGLIGLVDALFIFGGKRRCLHDYLAGTQVINA